MAQVEKHVSHRPLRPDYSRAHEAKSLRSEIGYTLRLGGPLALGELGWMSTYIVDALMIGRLANSPLAISASSLGNTIFYAIVFCAIYLMNGLETLIAQAYGQGDTSEGVILLAQSFWIVVVGTPLVMLSTLAALPLLPHLGTPPEIVAETARYVKPLVWSTAPLMAYMALRKFLQSVDRVLLITVSLVTASFVNWLGDYAFLFGHFGFKPMGVAGSAWGTLVVRFWMLGLLAVGTCLAVRQQGQQLTWSMLRPDGRRLKLLLGIGWPSGLQTLTELGVSTYTSILCARLGTILLAAHQVVLDLNAFVYQVPLGLAYATVTRVGQSAGRNSLPEVRRATNASLLLGMGFMAIAATAFAAFSHTWAGLYTNSAEVVRAAAPIFTLCAFGLLGDTTFVLLASALTGLGDTRTPMAVSLVWNWGIGMPLAYALGFHYGLGLKGLWLGRVVGSVGTAITIAVLWQFKLRNDRNSPQPVQLNLLPSLAELDPR
jgi:MATE family multidrug resistance protein